MFGILVGLAMMAVGAFLVVTRLPAVFSAWRADSVDDKPGEPPLERATNPVLFEMRMAARWWPVGTGIWLTLFGTMLFGWNLLRLVEMSWL